MPAVPSAGRGSVPAEPPPRRARAAILAALAGVAVAALAGAGLALATLEEPPPARPLSATPAPEDAGPADVDAGDPEPVEPAAEAAAEPEPRACPDHSGRWAGRWSATTSRGTWTAEFREDRDDDGAPVLHGDIRVTGTACGTGGHIVGRILDDCSVEFDPYRTGPCRVRYEAVFDGDSMRGTLAATGFGMADSGRWRGARRGPLEPDP